MSQKLLQDVYHQDGAVPAHCCFISKLKGREQLPCNFGRPKPAAARDSRCPGAETGLSLTPAAPGPAPQVKY